jgi:hypothetical protein
MVTNTPNPEAQAAYNKIFEIVLALPPDDRVDVWSSVTFNGVFCVHCGIGNVESPNPRCQCTNDE